MCAHFAEEIYCARIKYTLRETEEELMYPDLFKLVVSYARKVERAPNQHQLAPAIGGVRRPAVGAR
jgi:hypothetical protein